MTGSSSDWRCTHCGESNPPTFDACWNCGTTRDGLRAPFFQAERNVADDSQDDPAWTLPQFGLRDLFVLTTGIAVFLGALFTLGPDFCFLLMVVLFVASLFALMLKNR